MGPAGCCLYDNRTARGVEPAVARAAVGGFSGRVVQEHQGAWQMCLMVRRVVVSISPTQAGADGAHRGQRGASSPRTTCITSQQQPCTAVSCVAV